LHHLSGQTEWKLTAEELRNRLVRKSSKALLRMQKFFNVLEEKPLTHSPHSANLLTGQTLLKKHQTFLLSLSASGISRSLP
jgi:hypothetical protein